MDQDISNANSINFAPNDPAYAPVNPPQPATMAEQASTVPAQPTSVSDQIAAFGQAQQAVADLPMVPVTSTEPVANAIPAAPQFVPPMAAQPVAEVPIIPPAAPVAPIAPVAESPIAPAVLPVEAPAIEPVVPTPGETVAVSSTEAKKSSLKSMLILVAVFVVLFGLAALIGYSLGFKAGQASMPGM